MSGMNPKHVERDEEEMKCAFEFKTIKIMRGQTQELGSKLNN